MQMATQFKRASAALLLAAMLLSLFGCNTFPPLDPSDTQTETVETTETDTTETTEDTDNIHPDGGTGDPEALPSADALREVFYGDSDPADSYEEAIERSRNYQLSGATEVPDQAPTLSLYMPMSGDKYIRNNEPYYADTNTYVVVDALGREIFRVYRGGGYITLEEVAAHLYAFGELPANYTSKKVTSVSGNPWGEHLRGNHSKFSGNTSKYPYEPALPRISGCGGDLTYYEVDIGTTGTDCDPSYTAAIYNDGTRITRGAARIVYTVYDANQNKIIEPNEKYLFYTYNHYNDFQEYLNYFGGWGEMFGNITGGGKISSKTDCNPTPYVPIVMGSLKVTKTLSDAQTERPAYLLFVCLPVSQELDERLYA